MSDDLCVVMKNGMHYAGMVDGSPHWLKTKPGQCLFHRSLAEKIATQLTHLGHSVEVKPWNYATKK